VSNVGYFGFGEENLVKLTAKWADSTNKGRKHHVVRVAIGTSNQFEYPHSADDYPVGVLITEGTYNNRLAVSTEGVAICVNSLAGTINIGDPVVYDHGNSGGTVGKVMSGAVGPVACRGCAGTNWSPGTSWLALPQPITYPVKPGSLKFGTAQEKVWLPEGGCGTVFYFELHRQLTIDKMYYTINEPIIGIALDQANSPNDELRVKLTLHDTYKKAV